jgi:hypothetical protein
MRLGWPERNVSIKGIAEIGSDGGESRLWAAAIARTSEGKPLSEIGS